MNTRPHEKLDVYRIAHALALRVHRLTFRLPKFELYEEGSQARRSSKSVSNQIVEGHALRRHKAQYVQYLARAYGSAEETIEPLRYIIETGSVRAEDQDEAASFLAEYGVLARKVYNYMTSVQQRHDTSFYVREEEEGWGIDTQDTDL